MSAAWPLATRFDNTFRQDKTFRVRAHIKDKTMRVRAYYVSPIFRAHTQVGGSTRPQHDGRACSAGVPSRAMITAMEIEDKVVRSLERAVALFETLESRSVWQLRGVCRVGVCITLDLPMGTWPTYLCLLVCRLSVSPLSAFFLPPELCQGEGARALLAASKLHSEANTMPGSRGEQRQIKYISQQLVRDWSSAEEDGAAGPVVRERLGVEEQFDGLYEQLEDRQHESLHEAILASASRSGHSKSATYFLKPVMRMCMSVRRWRMCVCA